MKYIVEFDLKTIKAAIKHWAETEITLPRGSRIVGMSVILDAEEDPIAKIAITDEATDCEVQP
jgi:hypothetical protein